MQVRDPLNKPGTLPRVVRDKGSYVIIVQEFEFTVLCTKPRIQTVWG